MVISHKSPSAPEFILTSFSERSANVVFLKLSFFRRVTNKKMYIMHKNGMKNHIRTTKYTKVNNELKKNIKTI